MSGYQKKSMIQPKYEIHLEEAKQASEPSRAGILELSGQEFKTTMIHMLRALMDKVGSLQEQIGNVNRDGTPKNQKKLWRSKTLLRNEECGLIIYHDKVGFISCVQD